MEYYGKKSIKTFVGQILSAESGLFTVKYLVKSKFGEKYTFPENNDVDEIQKIIQKLDEPMFDTKDITHSVFNIKAKIKTSM